MARVKTMGSQESASERGSVEAGLLGQELGR